MELARFKTPLRQYPTNLEKLYQEVFEQTSTILEHHGDELTPDERQLMIQIKYALQSKYE